MPNIKLKGQTGEVLTYEDVERVYFDDADKEGEYVFFTHGLATSKTVEPDFASGDMKVEIPKGELVTELTIEQPDTLLPENIRAGVTVAGVVGDLIGDTEEVTVDLDMTEGNQTVEPSAENKVLSKVVVTKPETMVPENIRAGIDIGGIVGDFIGDTEERTVDLHFPVGSVEEVVLAEQTFTSALSPTYGYSYNPEGDYALTIEETYRVMFDGVEYTCVAMDGSALMEGAVFIGNAAPFGLTGNNEPFAIGVVGGGLLIACLTDTEPTSHTVAINRVTEGVSDMEVTPSADGKVLSKVTITKPETLIPENIAKDVEIGGVVGTFEGGGGGGGDYTVTVIDYDGTILAEKNLNEGDTFNLPSAPSHEGLVFDGWSSPVAITDNTVTVENQDIVIGPMYHTESGATEIDIVLTAQTEKTFTFLSVLTGMTSIDWGDGTTDNTLTHTYSDYGEYTIKIYGMTATADGSTSTGGIVARYNYTIVAVRFASTVTRIGIAALYFCYSLKHIVIPSSVTSIGENAFNGSRNTVIFIIPSGVTSIAESIIGNNHALKNIVIPFGATSIGNYAFQTCYSLTNVAIPSSVTSIGNNVFANDYSLKSAVIPSGVTSIGVSVFSKCYALERVVIPSGVTSIGSKAFEYCYKLETIVIPSGVTSIGSSAFYYCTSFTNIVIPSGVTSIPMQTFYGCTAMKVYDFTAYTKVPALAATDAFKNINYICQILVPSSLYSAWKATSNWSTYANYIVAK